MSQIDQLDLPGLEPKRTTEISLFSLLDPSDTDYSHFVSFYDAIPKFIDQKKRRYLDCRAPDTPTSLQAEFAHRVAAGQSIRRYQVTLRPASITIKDELGSRDVFVYPSMQRDELVYDALRKITTAGQGGLYGAHLGASFTLNQVFRELQKYKRTMSFDEIKESLKVLRGANMEVRSLDGDFEWEPAYLSNLALVSRSRFEKEGADARCVALFDSLVTEQVSKLQFREYNHSIAMGLRSAVARYLVKRIYRNYTHASPDKPYNINLTTVFREVYRTLDSKMSNNARLMSAAFSELKKERVIQFVHEEPVKDSLDRRKTIDYRYTIAPHEDLISDHKRFHAKARRIHAGNVRKLSGL